MWVVYVPTNLYMPPGLTVVSTHHSTLRVYDTCCVLVLTLWLDVTRCVYSISGRRVEIATLCVTDGRTVRILMGVQCVCGGWLGVY